MFYKTLFVDPDVDRELQALIREAKDNYDKVDNEKSKPDSLIRLEFNNIHEGLSSLHFHLTLFLLLTLLAVLNVPSVITWANDYQ